MNKHALFMLVMFLSWAQLSSAFTVNPIPEKAFPASISDFKADYMNEDGGLGAPAVFRGYASNWKATKKWTPEYFAEHYSEFKVGIQTSEKLSGEFGAVETEYKESTLGDYLANIELDAEEIGYLAQFPLVDNAPEL
ncbi:MAG: hypothetical protein O2897_02575, partial [bacterium]|nr:hypothetical protein [bacterium]